MVNFSLRYCSCFDHVWEQDFSTFDWVCVGGEGGGRAKAHSGLHSSF